MVYFITVLVFIGFATSIANVNNLCFEKLVMHAGIIPEGVQKIGNFFNNTEVISAAKDKTGNLKVSPEHEGRWKIGTMDEITIILYNMSSVDTGSCKAVVTFESGSYTVIIWQIIFTEKGQSCEIKFENKTTTPLTQTDRSDLVNKPIPQKYMCNQARLDCFLMDETFTCLQQGVKQVLVTDRENCQNMSVWICVSAAVIAAVIIAIAIAITLVYVRKNQENAKGKSRENPAEKPSEKSLFVDDDTPSPEGECVS